MQTRSAVLAKSAPSDAAPMWNPSSADKAELQKLMDRDPVARRHIGEILGHFAAAAEKVAFYEKQVSPEVIAKANGLARGGGVDLAKAMAGMTDMEKAVLHTVAAGGRAVPRIPTAAGRMEVVEVAPADSLAKRAGPGAPPSGKAAVSGMAVPAGALAALKGAKTSAGRFAPNGYVMPE